MARRSQCSSAGENPLDPNYLPPHYREEYRLAIDALIEADLEGYYGYLSEVNVVDFLCLPEIEYIKCTVREPRQTAKTDRRYALGDADGSSDTYWPTHSDLDAPELDLGWPQQHRFVGPTEITTLVNPSDPEMPSIKEQARRMIRSAQQVIAVAMDMFTDIDIFADIVNAAMRNVAVYVLLDEYNAQHFVAMANNCRVNLDEIKFMRVRTISGSTYFCHTGKSFKGQMMNRFMLVDCRVVLSGNYSFMWSFEKIHRCIAHVFFGELVTTFDEEFRILYAQSEPLIATNAITYADDYGNFPGRQHNTYAFRKEYPPFKDNRTEWLRHSFDEHMNKGPKMMPLRRGEVFHRSTEDILPHTINATQQFIGEQPFLEQRRPMRGPTTKEIGSFKGSGHTGGPSYVYAQKNAVNIGNYHDESMEIPSHHFPREEYFHQRPGPGYKIYAKPRDQSYHQYDQYSDPDFASEKNDAEESGDYDHVQRYLQSYPPMEEERDENVLVPVKSASRRHSMGQSFGCQTSAMQLNLPDQKQSLNIRNRKSEPKEGLRVWRISSYLSALRNTGQPDIEDLQSSDSCEDVPYGRQGTPEPDISTTRQEKIWFTKGPTSKNTLPVQQINIPEITVDLTEAVAIPTNAGPKPASASESSCTTDGDNKEPKETNSFYEEFFRKKPNLALQKNSRLRHSLIFNSKLDQDTLEEKGNSLDQTDEDNLSKQSFVVSSILEKKRHSTKKPIQWTHFIKSSGDTASETEDISSKTGETSEEKKLESPQSQKVAQEEICIASQKTQPQDYLSDKPRTNQSSFVLSDRGDPFIDMNDPESRLRFFKELAAKRKAEQAPEIHMDTSSKEPDKPETAPTSDTAEEKVPALKSPKKTHAAADNISASPQTQPVSTLENSKDTIASHLRPKVSIDTSGVKERTFKDDRLIATTATDAEKIKHKKKLSEDRDSSLDIAQKENATTKPRDDLMTQTKHTNLFSKIPNISSLEFIFPRNKLPDVTESGYSLLCLSNLKLDSVDSQVNTAANSNANVNAQETSSSVNDFLVDVLAANPISPIPSLNITTSETSASQQSTSVELGQAKHLASTNGLTFTHTTASQTGHCKKSIASEVVHAEYSGTTDTASSMDITVIHTDQHPTCPSQIPTATEAFPSQVSNTTETRLSQISTANKTSPSKLPTETETCPPQLPTEKKTCHSKLSNAAQTVPFQQTTATVTNSLHSTSVMTPVMTGPPQHVPSAEKDTSQHTAETSIDTVKHPTVMETRSPQQFFATETGPSQQPSAEPDSLQPATSTQTGLSQSVFVGVTHTPQCPAEIDTSTLKYSTVMVDTDFLQNPSATEYDLSRHLSAAKTDNSQHPVKTDTSNLKHSTVTESGSSQQPSLTKIDPSQQSIATETASEQNPTATETGNFQHVTKTDTPQCTPETDTSTVKKSTVTDTVPSQHPSLTRTGSSNKPTKTETYSLQNASATESDPSQHVSTVKTDSSQCPPETDTGNLKHSSVTETGPSQHSSPAKTWIIQQPTATEIDSLQNPTAAETGLSQHDSAAKTNTPQPSPKTNTGMETVPSHHPSPSQQPTATEKCSLLPTAAETSCEEPPETETGTLEYPTVMETGPSQHVFAAKTDTSQHPPETDMGTITLKPSTVIETGSSQSSTATYKDSLQNPTLTETGTSKHPTGTSVEAGTPPEMGLSQQPTAMETDSLQDASAIETVLIQPPTATETDSLQNPTVTETGTSKHPAGTSMESGTPPEMGLSQQPTAMETDSFQHASAIETVLIQPPTATETDSLQNPTAAETGPSQHIPAAKTDTTQHSPKTNTGMETVPSHHPSETNAGPSQQSTATEKCSLPNPTAAGTGTLEHTTIMETGSSQHVFAAKTDTPQHPPETDMGTITLKPSTVIETGSSQSSTATDRDSLLNSTVTETCPSKHFTAEKTDTSQPLLETGTGTSKKPTKTSVVTGTPAETGLSQQTTAMETDSLQHLSAGPFKHVSFTKTDSSQNLPETDARSLKHSNATETGPSQHICAIEIKPSKLTTATKFYTENYSEAKIDNSELSSVKSSLHCTKAEKETHLFNKDPYSIASSSSITDNNLVDNSADHLNVTLTDKLTTQDNTQSGSCLLSNPDNDLCSSDQPKSDEIKNEKPKKNEKQQHVQITDSVSSGAISFNEDNEVQKIQENTEQVESPRCSHAELKAETCQTTCSDSVNQQPLSAENSTRLSHQSSTVNLLSCSNLRDDTKVLLEQISAKNQEKASKLNPSVDEANDNLKLDKQMTVRHWAPTWSAKASPKEREELLEKMEKKRKERIYSRFEVP